MRHSQAREVESDGIDITPMLDVVFIMLIFFVVTASFVKEPGAQVERPNAESASNRPSASILVAITDNNRIWIDQKPVEPSSVQNQLEQLRQENPRGTVMIQADRNSKNRLLVQVLDAAKRAGVVDVAISAENSDS